MSNYNAVVGALPLVIRAWSESNDAEVVIGGDRAYVDWATRKTHLPTLPFDDDEVAVLAYGFSGHESGHLVHTNPDERRCIKTPLQQSLYQPVEDVRMERAHSRNHPGINRWLGRLVEKLVRDGQFSPASPDDHPATILSKYVLYRLRYEVLQQTGLENLAPQAEAVFRETFPKSVCTKVGALLGEVPGLSSTAESAAIAMQLISILEEALEEPPPEQTENNDEPDQEEGDGSSPDGQGAKNITNGDQPGQGSGGSMNEPLTPEQRALIEQVLAATENDVPKDFDDIVAQALEQEAREAVQAQGGGAGLGLADGTPVVADGRDLLSEVQAMTNGLRTKLRRKLEAQSHIEGSLSNRGRQIDRGCLVNAAMGQRRVFRVEKTFHGVSTDIAVLFDVSGSMSDHPGQFDMARKSVMAASVALDGIEGVTVTTGAFPGSTHPVRPLAVSGEGSRTLAGRMMTLRPSGGTPLAEALLWGYEQVFRGRGNRKVVIVVTDGSPAQTTVVEQVMKVGHLNGIEIYGIGIITDYGRRLFDKWVCVTDFGELPDAMFRMIRSGLHLAA